MHVTEGMRDFNRLLEACAESSAPWYNKAPLYYVALLALLFCEQPFVKLSLVHVGLVHAQLHARHHHTAHHYTQQKTHTQADYE
jgi:hypothetical protein